MPPRLPEPPIFYPVLNRDYHPIARDWNVKHSGAGCVTEFDVDTDYLDRFEIHKVGGRKILEYWIPAEGIDDFNRSIGGPDSGGRPLVGRRLLTLIAG